MDRRFYVYLHKTMKGVPFYVGKGTGKRAWSRERHPTWNHYVATRLGGHFEVEIVADDLSEDEALELEDDWMRQLGSTLINLQNFHRGLAMDEFGRSDALRTQINELTRLAELADVPNERARLYGSALKLYAEQSSIVSEVGLFGDILSEMPVHGPFDLINGHVAALVAEGDLASAHAALVEYDARYTASRQHKGMQLLHTRVARLSAKGIPTVANDLDKSFVPPENLPADWEWAHEDGRSVARLKRSLRPAGASFLDLLGPIRALKGAGLNEEALAVLKSAIVAAESTPAGMAPFYTNEGAIVARKLGNPLEECLILHRYINHPNAVPYAVPAMIKRIRKASAAWQKLKSA